ncbi:hypothetical protein ACFVVC_01220 [Pseudarthrobacter sp. NPDC058196]|uniref:hypothetical protein n=1 Tax=Pseudarthrobacter sp. NPDC058196 TaxID=3346376 RepID=UPI0036DD425F
MSQGLNEIMPSTDELMDVDTSFLDAYRTGGSEGLKRAQQRAQQPEPERDTPEKAEAPQPSTEDPDRDSGAGQRGGSGASSATPPAQSDAVAVDPAATAHVHDDADDEAHQAVLSVSPPEDATLLPSVPLQHTDHQDSVQSAAARGGSGGGDEGSGALPQTGFRLDGVKSQPAVRALPETIVGALRKQLRSAAVRELGVGDTAAREFAERLSQASLVTAFLLAQLDLGLATDAATRRAAQLFRSRDPLLGSIAARMETLERWGREQSQGLAALHGQLGEVKETSAAIEQAVAYSIADRTSNFLRGSHDVHEAPITHKDAVFVRDRVREATKKQAKLEREREGRPIR